ncbi:MAG: DEAD/DEAH box helicase, partial [Ilumatobacteraceae bacterium]
MTGPSRYPFELDRFQRDAIAALDAGRHVVVAAPTGSGKTVVAEHGVELALGRGRRAFYTAPIKALSNQKYRDLVAFHGEGRVGLLTGDNAVDPDAPVVVMTTEVLRNMIYGRRRSLADLDVVVLDEVHFLQDAYRGPVWEEVIIHLPRQVQLVCLSATVSNAAELAEWITTVRGPTDVVVEERRPVELEQHYLVADRTADAGTPQTIMLPVFTDGKPNRRAQRLDASAIRRSPARRGERSRDQGSGRRRLATPGRVEATRLLEQRSMLPAIYFIFSRHQCDEAARTCRDAGLQLTTADERARIRDIAHDRLDGLHAVDLAVLGHRRFLDQLEAGIAAHHAGMVPPFKEVVEACFVEGLVKVVFATETLAVGINMPARTVVIEKLTKFTGERHEQLSPGQFTQLTGRAGRRGIDPRGHAVVAWSPFVRFEQVAELAASRSFHLRSVFRPTYNMAANLVRNYSDEEAHRLLSLSFAQFQTDRDVVRLEARLERRRNRLEGLLAEARSPYGDIDEYRHRGDAPATPTEAIDTAMAQLRPGAVIRTRVGRYEGPVAVVANASRSTGQRLTVITPSGHHHQLRAADLGTLPVVIGSIELPDDFAPGRKEFRRDVGRRLRSAGYDGHDGARDTASRDLTHPVEADPDLRERLRAAGRADRVRGEIRDLERRAEPRDQTLAREFDAVLGVLATRRYVDRSG